MEWETIHFCDDPCNLCITLTSSISTVRPTARLPSGDARRRIARWIRGELGRHPPRAKSLVITAWGDAIAPHGGAVWLGNLIRLLAPLGLNERLVRTSVYRLTREGWLEARQDGRRSLYRLTSAGRERFEHAYRRIYAPPLEDWRGEWDLVLARAPALAPTARRELKRELGWEGFGNLVPGIFLRPARDGSGADLAPILRRLDAESSVTLLRACDVPGIDSASLRDAARNGWDLVRIASEYRAFLARFRVVADSFQARRADPEQAFVVRMLLIHAFRRVSLHDPQLPRELAPAGWPATRAYALCRELYRRLERPSEEHLAATLQAVSGPLQPSATNIRKRFSAD